MSGYSKFVAVYQSNIIDTEQLKAVVDPVKIEIFKGPRTLKMPEQKTRILAKGERAEVIGETSLNLEENKRFILIESRTTEKNPIKVRAFCESEVDKAITKVAITSGSEIFDHLIYKGWISSDTNIADGWVMVADKVKISEELLTKEIAEIRKRILSNTDINTRFGLMSRFFVKALNELPGEEKFVWLWTILEIFPMKESTNVKPISAYLEKITGYKKNQIDQLEIGRIYGWRCDLIHHGKWSLDISKVGTEIKKLENIVKEILRGMAGLSYGKSLDRYLNV